MYWIWQSLYTSKLVSKGAFKAHGRVRIIMHNAWTFLENLVLLSTMLANVELWIKQRTVQNEAIAYLLNTICKVILQWYVQPNYSR